MKPDLQVHVIQQGARHRYAIPRILHSHGMLAALFTDSHSSSYLGLLSKWMSIFKLQSAQLARLSRRKISGVPSNLIMATDAWVFKKRRLDKLAAINTQAWLDERDRSWFGLSEKFAQGESHILYSMGGENLRLLDYVRKTGGRVAVDAFINPLNLRQTRDEKNIHAIKLNRDEVECDEVENHYRNVFARADIILCPSEWVAEGVRELCPEHAPKIRICPYGSSLPPSAVARAPVRGRIFWAGGDWFRKGLHHLAAAADLALKEFPAMEFRIAGITDPAVIALPQFRNLRFLGKLDRAGMQEEFSKADLFVFPTLTEGMASVMVEAVSAGCPVLATPGAGFDGLEESGAGRIFDAEDHAALAKLMLNLTRDRATLQAMNEACHRFAPNFTEEAWAKRLVKILKELM